MFVVELDRLLRPYHRWRLHPISRYHQTPQTTHSVLLQVGVPLHEGHSDLGEVATLVSFDLGASSPGVEPSLTRAETMTPTAAHDSSHSPILFWVLGRGDLVQNVIGRTRLRSQRQGVSHSWFYTHGKLRHNEYCLFRRLPHKIY